jgi:hypothetical protein
LYYEKDLLKGEQLGDMKKECKHIFDLLMAWRRKEIVQCKIVNRCRMLFSPSLGNREPRVGHCLVVNDFVVPPPAVASKQWKGGLLK